MIAAVLALVQQIGWRRLATGALVVVGLVALEAFLHDPFGWRRAKLDQLAREASAAHADADARAMEVKAERVSAVRVKSVTDSQVRTRAATEALAAQAQAAPDAAMSLDETRLARLRAHDAALCAEIALTGCDGGE